MEQMRKIEEDLVCMLTQLTTEFPWLSARYEYRDPWATFLVSYAPSNKMFSDDNVLLRMMELENELIAKYEDDAPLFCEEERLFSLTPGATLIEYGCVKRDQESIAWSSFRLSYTYSGWDKSDYQSKEYNYSLAA
ncbi:hypothetical protein [Porphyromonas sp.]